MFKRVAVDAVLFQKLADPRPPKAPVLSRYIKEVLEELANDVCQTIHDLAALRFLTIIILGATPSPCPTVAFAPVPVYVTTLNPAVVLALTVEVIVPTVLLPAVTVPPAFQFQATNEEPELFN